MFLPTITKFSGNYHLNRGARPAMEQGQTKLPSLAGQKSRNSRQPPLGRSTSPAECTAPAHATQLPSGWPELIQVYQLFGLRSGSFLQATRGTDSPWATPAGRTGPCNALVAGAAGRGRRSKSCRSWTWSGSGCIWRQHCKADRLGCARRSAWWALWQVRPCSLRDPAHHMHAIGRLHSIA